MNRKKGKRYVIKLVITTSMTIDDIWLCISYFEENYYYETFRVKLHAPSHFAHKEEKIVKGILSISSAYIQIIFWSVQKVH